MTWIVEHMVDVLVKRASVILTGVVSTATQSFAILDATSMDNARTELVCASRAGMGNIVRWKVAQLDVRTMVNAV